MKISKLMKALEDRLRFSLNEQERADTLHDDIAFKYWEGSVLATELAIEDVERISREDESL